MSQPLKPDEIRSLFLRFFEKNGHRPVPSSSLVPKLDPTLLFTNAGMNQFKAVFTGQEKRDYKRATSAQKCVRAGGKHNDLENVGRTARHLTFFEMLGNFSFGDYFKKEAIAYAWEFVTQELKLDPTRLYASIFKDDETAFQIWTNDIGLDPKRIYRFGEKDNFWSMGDTGPCGPCSELFYDQGPGVGCGKPECAVGCDCDRYIEFWNLVFMEFEQQADGSRQKLPKPSIDTGMGLERISAIVAGVPTNYDTDLFTPILDWIGKKSGHDYLKTDENSRTSMRVIADHIRCMVFLISGGVHPSNDGRGYVLRRIMRRAMRHGRNIGLTEPFLHDLSSVVVERMGSFYPELKASARSTRQIIQAEEVRFAETIDRGLSILQEEIEGLKSKKQNVLSGEVSFRLYDTFGFPVDLTADVLRENGMTYDEPGFEAAFSAHREKARGSWKGSGERAIDGLVRQWVEKGIRSEFLGYREFVTEGEIRALVKEGKAVDQAKEGDEVELIADRTPFYGESGGQVGDIGSISGADFSIEVVDTQKPAAEIVVHKCKITDGTVKVGARAVLQVDLKARAATAKNHTATHMLHATLKEVLGEHVKQAGSLVSPERLRFDFSNPKALTPHEITTIEQKMNERIWLDSPVQKEVLPLEKALATGAVALFDEKYGDQVRVITLSDYSKELCGGTHLDRTGEIGIFKITKESSVAAGVRRLEATTGFLALAYVQETDIRLKRIAQNLGTTPEQIDERLEKLLAKQKELEKGTTKKKNIAPSATVGNVLEVNGVKLECLQVSDADHKELRDLADRQLAKLQSGIVAIGSEKDGKAFIVVKVSKDLATKFNAGQMIKSAANLLGGSGGGRPDMAQAGGPNTQNLKAALDTLQDALK